MKSFDNRLAAIGLSVLLLTGGTATLAFAGHKGHHGCGYEGRFGPAAAISQLDNLSEAQKNDLKQIRVEARDAMRDLRDAMRDTRSELRTAMRDSADLEIIRGLAEKQGERTTELILLRAQVRDKINAVLTEEQRQQLSERRELDQGFGKRRGMHRF